MAIAWPYGSSIAPWSFHGSSIALQSFPGFLVIIHVMAPSLFHGSVVNLWHGSIVILQLYIYSMPKLEGSVVAPCLFGYSLHDTCNANILAQSLK